MKERVKFMIRKNIFCITVALLLVPGLSLVQTTRSQDAAKYVGNEKCSPCHADIYKSWQDTRHAKAIDSLKKTGQEGLAACVKCHVTAYEKDDGFLDYELTPEMAGVQCEACHGPGGKHVSNPMGEKAVKTPGEALCRECHTQGQDPGFNYEEKAKLSHNRK
jgi:predicted CXXCH cytochrome family protein